MNIEEHRKLTPGCLQLLQEKDMVPTTETFRKALLDLLAEARSQGQSRIRVAAKDLHRRVGGYPRPNHRMPMCCDVMYEFMRHGDTVLAAPPKRKGAALLIEYLLPQR
jgi:5-methylcytosine-specific restriction protein A